MKLWQAGVFGYGVLYALLANAMEAENLHQGYPIIYVGFSIIAQTVVVVGIFLFGFGANPNFARRWQWLFPYLILELVWGLVLDASVPSDYNFFTHEAEWIKGLLFSLCIAAPAYYFNYRLARYKG
jgi:hypothetical protein